MRRNADRLRRLAELERHFQANGDGAPGDVESMVAEDFGLASDDPLVPVLADQVVAAELRRLLRGGDGGEAILDAARAGLKSDPTGYRSRVLAEDAKRREPSSRYDPMTKAWIFRGSAWVTPEQWDRSLDPDRAAGLATISRKA